ncbi:spidroin-1-like [Crassostrea angulata]|uniref:spidroin-1-like n=1 Tax=Magallana angulata TaxID=2784310 RepID=UPI0022B10D8D|nr:spidroin-1-like [Crassostrea angulata]
MIPAVVLLCLVAGAIALPVNTDYYPKSQGYGGHKINGGFIGINNNGFESSILGLNGGNSAAAAAAAASGLNSAAAAAAASNAASTGLNNGFDAEYGLFGGNSAAAAAASSAQRTSFNGLHGHSEQHLIGSNYGPFVHQVQPVQFQAVQQFPGLGGSSAAAAAAAAGQQSAAAAAAAAAGQNAAAAAAAAAGRNAAAAAAAAAGQNAAAAAAASASGANFGSHLGIRGSQFAGQIGGQFVQPSPYYPNVVGQNSGSAAAAAAASNNAAAAAAASASANGFNGGIIGGSTGVIGSKFVPGKKY